MNIRDWLQKATLILCNSSTPKLDAQIILSFVLGKSRTWLCAFDEISINHKKMVVLEQLLMRRMHGEPIAYLIGKCEFWSLTLSVTRDTIIPRCDTEILVEQALMYLHNKPLKVLDLGTGTGAIALAIASERPKCKVVGVDFIESVIKNAQNNAINLNITNVNFIVSYWFNNLPLNKFDLIVSNPPYVEPNSQYLNLGDIIFEPISALVSKENGLADLKIIIQTAVHWLKYNGLILLEHGWRQSEAVHCIMQKHGYRNIHTVKDYAGNPRVTLGFAPKLDSC
ncbi:peptide chain release factor N(5)-glutamine methyltransferase [Candidatus Pantoea edessiphila]|uniref:Release factor glutamine methyltransferase n=1 Tax=Candidatus Pantoea edessiphila TaxID=2044610 RepID=A0A2P5SWW0_9GAMM|nr:peptide chain release factor N(5)-glutamine methyltransferase [Candidatus Pantoea edessiphila]PPI86819.1 protein-(glutamine-N5) methyltransferase, release factor-specific [Candidatus Pantoea edessiphila]